MTEQTTGNVSLDVDSTDEAFLKSNSLTDLRHLVVELSELGEDTTDISHLVDELEELYNEYCDLPVNADNLVSA